MLAGMNEGELPQDLLHKMVKISDDEERDDDLNCRDCGIDAWMFVENGRVVQEDYVVHDDVWAAGSGDASDGVLCIGCFERRLGRELRHDDFMYAPFVMMGMTPSERYFARLAIAKRTRRRPSFAAGTNV